MRSAHHNLGHRSLRFSQGSTMLAVLLLAAGPDVVVNRVQAAGHLPIIPQPMVVEPGQGSFSLAEGVTLVVDDNAGDLASVGRVLQDALGQDAGLVLAVDEADDSLFDVVHVEDPSIGRPTEPLALDGVEHGRPIVVAFLEVHEAALEVGSLVLSDSAHLIVYTASHK